MWNEYKRPMWTDNPFAKDKLELGFNAYEASHCCFGEDTTSDSASYDTPTPMKGLTADELEDLNNTLGDYNITDLAAQQAVIDDFSKAKDEGEFDVGGFYEPDGGLTATQVGAQAMAQDARDALDAAQAAKDATEEELKDINELDAPFIEPPTFKDFYAVKDDYNKYDDLLNVVPKTEDYIEWNKRPDRIIDPETQKPLGFYDRRGDIVYKSMGEYAKAMGIPTEGGLLDLITTGTSIGYQAFKAIAKELGIDNISAKGLVQGVGNMIDTLHTRAGQSSLDLLSTISGGVKKINDIINSVPKNVQEKIKEKIGETTGKSVSNKQLANVIQASVKAAARHKSGLDQEEINRKENIASKGDVVTYGPEFIRGKGPYWDRSRPRAYSGPAGYGIGATGVPRDMEGGTAGIYDPTAKIVVGSPEEINRGVHQSPGTNLGTSSRAHRRKAYADLNLPTLHGTFTDQRVLNITKKDPSIIALAKIAALEAGSGQYGAVMDTVINRMKSNDYPNTIEGVINQKYSNNPSLYQYNVRG